MDNTNKIKKCGSRRCGTCPYLDECNFFYSNSTRNRYFPKTGSLDSLDCKTENIVYLISCKICNIQYIGETKNSLQKRFSGHRSSIRKGTSGQLIHKHFQEDCHGLSNCSIFPIEKIDSTGLAQQYNNEVEKERALNRLRLERERFWISTLQTAYPFGLNSRVKGIGDFLPSQRNFVQFGGRQRRRKKKHSRRKPKRLRTKNEVSIEFVLRKHRELSNKPDYLHFFKTFLYGIPRSDLLSLRQRADNPNTEINERVRDIIFHISEHRLFKAVQVSTKASKEFYHLRFRDKGLDFINLSSILRNNKITSQIPIYFTSKDPQLLVTDLIIV